MTLAAFGDIDELFARIDARLEDTRVQLNLDYQRLFSRLNEKRFLNSLVDTAYGLVNDTRAVLLKRVDEAQVEQVKRANEVVSSARSDGRKLSLSSIAATKRRILNQLLSLEEEKSYLLNLENELVFGRLSFRNKFSLERKLVYMHIYDEFKRIKIASKSGGGDDDVEKTTNPLKDLHLFMQQFGSLSQICLFELIPIEENKLFYIFQMASVKVHQSITLSELLEPLEDEPTNLKPGYFEFNMGICNSNLSIYMNRTIRLGETEINSQTYINYVSASRQHICISYFKRYNQQTILYVFNVDDLKLKAKKCFNFYGALAREAGFVNEEERWDFIDDVCTMNKYGEVACLANYKKFLLIYDSALSKQESHEITSLRTITKEGQREHTLSFGGRIFSLTKRFIYALYYGSASKMIGLICRRTSSLVKLVRLQDLNILSAYWLGIDYQDTGIISLDSNANKINFYKYNFDKYVKEEMRLADVDKPDRLGEDYSLIENHSNNLCRFECLNLADDTCLYFFNGQLNELYVV